MTIDRSTVDPVLFGQFLVSRTDVPPPRPGFRRIEFLGLTIVFHEALQFHRIHFPDGEHSAAVLGHVIHDGALLTTDSELHLESDIDVSDPRRILAAFSGRFIFLVSTPDGESCMLFLDAFGTLPVVYSRDRRQAASSYTMLSAAERYQSDEEIARCDQLRLTEFDFSFEFHPVHAMREDGCERLLPNHCLDLTSFTAARYWPKRELIASDVSDTELARRAAGVTQRNMQAIAGATPVYCGMTAGRDSRVLLAAMRGAAAPELLCYTFDYGARTRQNCADLHIGRRLARRLRLDWRSCAVGEADEPVRRLYKFNTGRCVSANKARDFFLAAAQFRYDGTWTTGFGGEVAVAYFWKSGDGSAAYAAEDLLRRHELPPRPGYVAGVKRWLAELPEGLSNATIIELFYIENRLGCWASAHSCGTAPFRYHILPFADFNYIDACLAMSLEFRKSRQSQIEMIRWLDDDLLAIPFEKFREPLNFLWRLRRSRYGRPLRMVPYAVQPLWH